MKILLVNNHHFVLGGAERYYLSLGELLKKHGNGVAYFSTHDSRNVPTFWSKYFIDKVSTQGRNLKNLYKVLSGIIYSLEARKNIGGLLDKFKPDIVHLNNIYFRISPSIIFEIKKRNIPIVETVHDYHPISPNVNLYHDGAVCEITKGGKYYKAVLHKCVKDSYLISFLVAASFYLHDYWKIYQNKIDLFISPSRFLRKKLVDYGLKDSKIIYLPNFTEIGKFHKAQARNKNTYVLFFGVLLKHKGLSELLGAAGLLPEVTFKLVGDGPEEKNLKRLSQKLRLKNVDFLGRLDDTKLRKVISQSLFCIVPSLWYENMPYSILEAFSLGKPVIAARIGGIPEVVKNGRNGLLFEAGNNGELAEKIKLLWTKRKLFGILSNNALADVKRKYGQEEYYKKIMKIYKKEVGR